MKLLKALFVLALAVLVAAPAFAETQNVKVSGSIDAYWFYRSQYDLRDGDDNGTVSTQGSSEGDDFFRTNTQVEVSADLTDNVSTVINLVNQRDWNYSDASTNEFDVILDLAYVQMKEIFYSPLTLTIGRQDIWLGRGLIIGNNNTVWDTQASTLADEYSVTTAFDALRATLDFNPWTLDFIYSKISEGLQNPEDDRDLYVANVNYKFAEYNAVAEAYWVTEANRNTLASTSTPFSTNDLETHTIGGRVQFDPIAQMTLGGELAYQFGDYHNALNAAERDRDAWLFDIFGTYRFDNQWKPEVTVEYVHFSGEDSTTGDYNSWNALYRGKFWTAYGDFRQFQFNTDNTLDTSATTNQNLIQVKGGLKPMEDLLFEAAWTYFWFDETGLMATGADDSIGWEVDLQATYDYTEDVSFGLLLAWFVPGDYYDTASAGIVSDDTATDIVSSVKVTF